MKRIILICMVVGFGVMAFGQEQMPQKKQRQAPDPKERQEQVLNKMKEELNLTEDQSAKIQIIMDRRMEEGAKEREALKAKREEQTKALRDSRKAEMEARRVKNEAYNDEIKGLLTPEQAVKFDALVQKQKEKMKEHLRSRQDRKRPGKRPEGRD